MPSAQTVYPVPPPTPPATGAGGSNTQVQFNDSGAFGGDAGLVFDKTTGKLTVGKQLAISSGAVTTSSPVLDLAQTWNAGAVTFTGVKINVTDTASAAGSLLMDLQVGGSSKFNVAKDGTVKASVGYLIGTGAADAKLISNGGFPYFLTSIGNVTQHMAAGGWRAAGDGTFGFSSNATSVLAAADVSLFRDAAGTLAQRVGTAAQTFRIYNTTDAGLTNYERGKIAWESSVLRIGTEKGGTGSARALELQTDGTTRLTIGTTGDLTIADGKNVVLNTTTGTKIGTATTQKLGFFNAAPVVQPTAVADATDAASAITQLNALLAHMRTLGLIAT